MSPLTKEFLSKRYPWLGEIDQISIDSDWYQIVIDAFDKIDTVIKTTPYLQIEIELGDRIDILQIKEKRAVLNIYVAIPFIEKYAYIMRSHLREAEDLSAKVCERCGDPGERRCGTHWLLTLCDECWLGEKIRLEADDVNPTD